MSVGRDTVKTNADGREEVRNTYIFCVYEKGDDKAMLHRWKGEGKKEEVLLAKIS